MQDHDLNNVLGTIRKILHDDNAHDMSQLLAEARNTVKDELLLDHSMMVTPPKSDKFTIPTETTSTEQENKMTDSVPPYDHESIVDKFTSEAVERSFTDLKQQFDHITPAPKEVHISNHSPLTVEDIVRGEVREMVRSWLDTHLPSMVEEMVRAEIARLRPKS